MGQSVVVVSIRKAFSMEVEAKESEVQPQPALV